MNLRQLSRLDALKWTCAVVLGLSVTTAAWADCVDGVREITAAEREFYEKAYAALVSLLPPPPPNTQLRGTAPDPAKPSRYPSFCKGEREGAFDIAVGAGYLFNWPRAEAERMSAERKQLLGQVETLEALPPDQAARYKSLVEQSRETYNSQPRAKRGGPPLSEADRQLAERKIAEGKALDDQAKAIMNAHLASVAPQATPLRARAEALRPYPQELGVGLGINVGRIERADPKDGLWQSHGGPRGAGLIVHNVVVKVGGPEGAARQNLWEALDHARQKALVGQPLPSVADSKARSAALTTVAPGGPAATPAPVQTATPPTAQSAPPTPSAVQTAGAAQRDVSPAATAPRKDEAKPADASALTKDAATAVNKLKGLLGR